MDGIVQVAATDLLGESTQSLKVVSSKRLHPEEMDGMVEEARSHAEEDRQQRERIEAGIMADNLISAAEKVLEESSGPGAQARLEEIERAMLRAREALGSGNINKMRDRSQELRELLRVSGEGTRA